MSHHMVMQIFAATFLVCAAIVLVIDLAVDLTKSAARLKWSLLWYAARYLGLISATLLALDVLFY